NVADYFVKKISTPFQGGFFSYAKRFTEKIPVPDTSAQIADSIVSTVKRCLAAAKTAPETLPALEVELNALVYQAYGLDDADIAVIEAHLAGKSAVGAVFEDADDSQQG